MSITGLAIKRPILFIVFFIIIGGIGLFSYRQLSYELLPTLATPTITVITQYPGASPIDVENSVTKPIEDAVAGVSKSKKISSTSQNNVSIVSIEFTADADPDVAIQNVQRSINNALSKLPKGAKAPTLEKFNVNDLPVLKLAVMANLSQTNLYHLINEDIKNQLAQIKGVGKVEILGGTERQINIEINQNQLISKGFSIQQVIEAIENNNQDIPIGEIKETDQTLSIRLNGKINAIQSMQNIPIKTYEDGSSIFLKDIATIQDGAKDATILNSLNGKDAIALYISKQSDANAAKVSSQVKLCLQALEKQYAADQLKFNIVNDSSEFTLQSAHQVYDDLGIAIVLVAIVMLIFLHSLRNALIIMVSIPTSLFITAIMMYASGFTLNLMTLLAISLVIGVLVDDSIVVLENIYHHLEMGEDKKTAALEGRNEIGFSALSITLVDVVVFLPMAFVPGLVGSLIKEFSLVIVSSTLSSLLVSFTLTPMIASRLAKLEKSSAHSLSGKCTQFIEKQIERITLGYKTILSWSLRNKIIVIFVAIGILVGSLFLVINDIVGTEFLPQADKGEVSVFVKLNPGSTLLETQSAVQSIENQFNKNKDVTKIFATVGYQNDGFSEKTNSNIATINVSLLPVEKRTSSLTEISRHLRDLAMQTPGVSARVSPIGLFGANASPIQLLITGNNRDSILYYSKMILQHVTTIPGMMNARLSYESGQPEWSVQLDPQKLSHYGLSPQTVGMLWHESIYGNDDEKINDQNTEIKSNIQLDKNSRSQSNTLAHLAIPIAPNQTIYLDQLGKVQLQLSAASLERRNKKPAIYLLSDVSSRPVGNVGEDLKTVIDKLNLPSSIVVKYEGDLEQQGDSFADLGLALGTSLLLIYLIMVVLYNNWSYPFIILLCIPLAISGALLALAMTAKSINIFSIFGMIMMMGLVAKNGILLVDRTNHNLIGKEINKANIKAALLEAGGARLRPILMTTLAMVIGMLPLATASTASSAFSSGLAWVLIGGLSSSMLLTLVIVPIAYYSIALLVKKSNRIFSKQKSIKTIAILFILVGTISKSQAQIADSLSLHDAIHQGLEKDNQLKLNSLEIKKAKFAQNEALSYRYPQANLSLEYLRNVKPTVFFLPTFGISSSQQIVFDASRFQAIPASSKNAFVTAVNVSVPIFNASISGNIKSAILAEKSQAIQLKLSQWNIADAIRKAYFNVLLLQQNVAFAKAAANRATRNLSDSKDLMVHGYAMATDTLNAWSNQVLTTLNITKAEALAQQAKNYLLTLTGDTLGEKLYLRDSISMQLLTTLPNEQTLDTSELSQRPDFELNRVLKQQVLQEINNSKSLSKPSLSAVSQYMIQSQSDNFNVSSYRFPNSFYVGLQLNVPLFNGFRTKAKVQQNEVELQEMELKQIELKKQSLLELQNAIIALKESNERISSQKKIEQAKIKILQLIQQRWKKGFAKYADVADAELEIIKAQNELASSQYDFLNAIASYQKSIGIIE